MIDAAREFDARTEALAEATDTLVELVVAQIERLDALRMALAAFIEQPERGEGVPGATPAPASWSAAVSSPPGGGSPAITQPRAARPGPEHRSRDGRRTADAAGPSGSASGPVGTPPSASQPPAAAGQSGAASLAPVSGPVEPPAVSFECQYCGRSFELGNRRGLPTHERWCEQNPNRATPWKPEPVGIGSEAMPPGRPSRESFVCDRCTESFRSRQALAEHRRGHPDIPPATPVRRAFRTPIEAALSGQS